MATSLTKSELAAAYSPNIKINAALNRLSRWVKGDRDLLQKLYEAGYRDSQRILTAKQVGLIVDYLGEP